MNNFYLHARKTFTNKNRWEWIPYLHSLSGRSLWWPNKGFKSKDEAINYIEVHLQKIKEGYF